MKNVKPNKKFSKRSQAMFAIVTTAALALFFLVWSVYFSSSGLGKAGESVDDILDGAGNYDGDSLPNLPDWCDCRDGKASNKGCPDDIDITNTEQVKQEQQRCLEEIKKARKK